MPDRANVDDQQSGQRVGLWDRPRLRFLVVAYGVSWVFWLGAWVAAAATDAGDLLFNEALVFDVLFGGDPSGTLIALSLLSLLGVYGPMVAGVVASRADPAIPPGDLRQRVLRVGVGGRTYGLVALILL
ncbi:MAG: hypothetical protein WCA82_04765, partial [Jiangellales bacterium]